MRKCWDNIQASIKISFVKIYVQSLTFKQIYLTVKHLFLDESPGKVLWNAEDKDATENVDGVATRQGCHQAVKDIFLSEEPNYHENVAEETNDPN